MVNMLGVVVSLIALIIGLAVYGSVYSNVNLTALGTATTNLLPILPLVVVAVAIIGTLMLVR